ncbi:MAG: hypothetical protein JXB32_16075 [Deltaproteobacteria bacterium]|nr:hypothetical protein [Deltaproteobacteria bacterium]
MLALLCPAAATAGSSGTHLFAEANLGLGIAPVTYLAPDFAWGGMIGIGGKFAGFPLRFYAVAGAEAVDFTGDGVHPQTGCAFASERWYVDLYGGLRLLMPIFDQIRTYVDLLGGATYIDGVVARADGPSIAKQDWYGQFTLAWGLQYRWHENASTGVRAEAMFGGQDAELLDTYAGEGEGGGVRFSVMVTQTWHI